MVFAHMNWQQELHGKALGGNVVHSRTFTGTLMYVEVHPSFFCSSVLFYCAVRWCKYSGSQSHGSSWKKIHQRNQFTDQSKSFCKMIDDNVTPFWLSVIGFFTVWPFHITGQNKLWPVLSLNWHEIELVNWTSFTGVQFEFPVCFSL